MFTTCTSLYNTSLSNTKTWRESFELLHDFLLLVPMLDESEFHSYT